MKDPNPLGCACGANACSPTDLAQMTRGQKAEWQQRLQDCPTCARDRQAVAKLKSTGRIERIRKASDFVIDGLRNKASAAQIIRGLVADYGATFRRGNTNLLRCAGVMATCTWSEDKGLLDAWRRNATTKIMAEGAS